LLLLFPVAVVVIRARREAAKEPPAAPESTEGASGFGEIFALHQQVFSNPLADSDSGLMSEPEADSSDISSSLLWSVSKGFYRITSLFPFTTLLVISPNQTTP
jgi:hypothetical protein